MNGMIFSILAPLKQLQTLWRQITIRQTTPATNNNKNTKKILIPNHVWIKIRKTTEYQMKCDLKKKKETNSIVQQRENTLWCGKIYNTNNIIIHNICIAGTEYMIAVYTISRNKKMIE